MQSKTKETHALHCYDRFCAEIRIEQYADKTYGITLQFDWDPPKQSWDLVMQQVIPTRTHIHELPQRFHTLVEARAYGDSILKQQLWDEHGLKQDL